MRKSASAETSASEFLHRIKPLNLKEFCVLLQIHFNDLYLHL